MFKTLTIGSVAALLLMIGENTTKTPPKTQLVTTNTPLETAAKNYKNLCSSCHGEKVEMFVDRQWKHGKTKAELIKSITGGYPDNGMPSWGAVLKPKEVADMADYILTGLEKASKYSFASKPKSNIFSSSELTVKLDTIASGLKSPWGMAFLPGGDLIVTDKIGDIYRVGKNQQKTKVTGGPSVLAEGQGGLLDVELHPKFAENGLIYFSYSAFKTEGGDKLSTTAVMRAKLDGTTLRDQKIIFEAQPYLKTRHHYGSRMEFDRSGHLYVTVGDRGQHVPLLPQKTDNDCGKVHRLNDDGSIPTDNPFVKTADAHGSVFSYGHRNLQGLAMNPSTGEIWEHEHGPRGGDELNIIKKGSNYGWPVISYGINYDGTVLTPLTAREGMEQPLTYWIPSIAPSGMVFVTGDKYAPWKGDLLVGSLRFKYLNRCKIQNGKVVKEEILLENLGRMRNVQMGNDGYIYVGVEDPGYVFRLVPLPVK